MFSNRKIRRIFTVLVAVLMMGIAFGLVFPIIALITGGNLSVIVQNGPGYLIIRAIFFGVIALVAVVYQKETETRYAGIIGSILAAVGFAVSIFIS